MTDLSRRNFFRRSLKKATESVVSYADKKVEQKATQWIRPPFALDELDFLLSCTRCSECITACPHDVIFSLPANYGPTTTNTPALDLKNKACHLCEDWPCVNACEPKSLKLPSNGIDVADEELTDSAQQNEQVITNSEQDEEKVTEPLVPPKMAWVTISQEICLPFLGPECGACRSSCKVEGALTWDLTKPVINQDVCCGCGLCRHACITDPSSINVHNLSYQDKQ